MNGGLDTIRDVRPGLARRFAELAAGTAWFGLCVHLQTAPGATLWGLFAAAALVIAVLGTPFLVRTPRGSSGRSLIVAMSAPMLAFLAFNAFRHAGFIAWPMARAATIPEYLRLAYYHLVLAIALLAAVLWSGQLTGPPQASGKPGETWKHLLGSWNGRKRIPLVVSILMVWGWALSRMITAPSAHTGWVLAGFLGIALFKACLTGITEELCYRRLIQNAAVARFGPVLGIIFQSILYAAFHVYLGEVMFGKGTFLVCLLGIGLVFGAVTRTTGGIGWACAAHIALDVVVEWSNVS
jgi:membrane protease YdiL (CAAX protease family)